MEEGRWDESNTEKVRVEEKQRAVRRQRETEAERAMMEGKNWSFLKKEWKEERQNESYKESQSERKNVQKKTCQEWRHGKIEKNSERKKDRMEVRTKVNERKK